MYTPNTASGEASDGWYRRLVRLPVTPPVEPMLAKAVSGLPTDDGWLFEHGSAFMAGTFDNQNVSPKHYGWYAQMKPVIH